jgi:hypothetical protein
MAVSPAGFGNNNDCAGEVKKKINYPCNRPWRATGVRSRGPHIFQTIGSQRSVRLSALRDGRPLPPIKIPGTHFC